MPGCGSQRGVRSCALLPGSLEEETDPEMENKTMQCSTDTRTLGYFVNRYVSRQNKKCIAQHRHSVIFDLISEGIDMGRD